MPPPGGALGRQPIDPKAAPYVGKIPETGGTTGGSAPKADTDDNGNTVVAYTPFENAEVKWLKAEADDAKPAATRTPGTKPAVLLFVGKEDGQNCCAEFFEREVFTDAEVVKFTRANLLSLRIDRTSDAAKPFSLKNVGLVVQDSEGDEVQRFTACRDTSPAAILACMKDAALRTAKIRETTKEFGPLLQKAIAGIADDKIHEAASVLVRAQKEKFFSRTLREKIAGLEKTLDEIGQKRLEGARGWVDAGDPGHAWALDKKIAEEMDGLPAALAAKDAMKILEQDPETRARVRESRAQEALDAACALAKDGKKVKAEQALKAVSKDFDGTRAAVEAKRLAAEISDPAWKPAAPVEGR